MTARVLVADDNATVRRIVRVILEEAGYAVGEAIDGQQALEIVQRDSFDLVLIDFVMPRLNGYQLAQAIRSLQQYRELPLVLMSAKADQIGERFMRQTGAVDAITKPFPPDAIVAVVGHALARRSAPPQPTLVQGELHSQPSLIPPSPSEPPPAEKTSTDVQPVHAKPTMRDVSGIGSMVMAQAAAAQHFAELAGRALLPAVREASQRGASLDAGALAEVLSRALSPGELASIARDLRSFDPDLRGPIAFEGNLTLAPVGEVLQLLRLQQQTGLLVVYRKTSEVAVQFREGHIDLAVARNVSSEFLLGRYLMADGVIRREDLDRVLQARGPGAGFLGEQLVKQGFIGAQDLERALSRQTSEVIYEMLRWADGRYRFEHGVVLPEAKSAGLSLPVESLVLEGFRRVDEWRVIEQEVTSFDEVLARDEAVIEAVGPRLAREEQVILDVVDGARTVRDVCNAAAMSSFDGCRILYRLLRSRLVRRRAA